MKPTYTPGPFTMAVWICTMLVMPVLTSAEPIPFDSGRWTFVNADTVRVDDLLSVSGYVALDSVEFTDGVVSVDVRLSGARSYPGIIFRQQSPVNFERVYLRPHRAGLYPDAVQYTPTFNGMEGWQLYNGEGYTAAADLPADRWIHFEIEISGTQARVFLDNAEEPVLIVHDLKHGLSSGQLALQGPRDATARFANFEYREEATLSFDPPQTVEPTLGAFTDWELSQAFAGSDLSFEEPLKAQTHTAVQWQAIQSEPSGLVDIARFVVPVRGEASCVWARHTITADEPRVMKLNFGYSDYVNIFLNGELLYSGNSAYRERDPSFLGVVGLFDAVPLHLRQGQNELVMLIAESFGGWGFMAQDGAAMFQHSDLQSVWETERTFKYPESAAYDAKRDVVYVTNFAVSSPGFISKLRLDGEIESLRWVEGLNRPTGLCMHGDRLYVVERTGVAVINPETAEIEDRHPIPQARFLNDVTVTDAGDIYVSGSASAAIFKRGGDGEFDMWLQDGAIAQPNAILADGDRLLVGCSSNGTVKAVDLETKAISTFMALDNVAPMDGLAATGTGYYIVGDNNGRLFCVSDSGEKTAWLNTTVVEMNCADLTIIPERKMIIVPTWIDQRVVAYEYTLPR